VCLVVGDSLLVVDAAVQGDVDAEGQESHAASLSHTIARGGPGACACRSRRGSGPEPCPHLSPSCARTGLPGARSSGQPRGHSRGGEHACAPSVCRRDHRFQSSAYRTTPACCLGYRASRGLCAVPARARSTPRLRSWNDSGCTPASWPRWFSNPLVSAEQHPQPGQAIRVVSHDLPPPMMSGSSTIGRRASALNQPCRRMNRLDLRCVEARVTLACDELAGG
jgi:hypothetical protein